MKPVVIIGAGPSGLAAAYELTKNNVPVIIIERLSQIGGLSRTLRRDGAHYDIGPHRFFTKNSEVHQLWVDMMQEDLLTVERLTRIFYKNKFFYYPLQPMNALFGIGAVDTIKILSSYLTTRIQQKLSPSEAKTFEDWVVAQFGRRLFEIFFKTYTEKVWGIPCTTIGAEWAGQRIKGLSLWTAVMNAVFKPKSKKIKTLVDEFVFPRGGAGILYEMIGEKVVENGGKIITDSHAIGFRHEGNRIKAVRVENSLEQQEEIEGDAFLVSSPLSDGILGFDPMPPRNVVEAAEALRYRAHVGVDLEAAGNPFPDNWIYVHSTDVFLARVANYRNFSKEMARTEDTSPLTVEYFCFRGDHIWNRSDEQLIDLATDEVKRMGILKPDKISNAFVVRNEKAYPVLEIGYEKHMDLLKEYTSSFENFQPIGRCGMFRYNNMDHAIVTGLLAARNYMGKDYDVWSVNIDADYHESGKALSTKTNPDDSSSRQS